MTIHTLLAEHHLKNEINGTKISLKRPEITLQTAQSLFQCIDNNRDNLRQWFSWVDYNKQETDCYSLLELINCGFEAHRRGTYSVIEKKSGDLCGQCGILIYQQQNKLVASFGYWQDAKKCGNGYISEAIKLLEKEAFDNHIAYTIIESDTQNLSSNRIPKRLGYHLQNNIPSTYYSPYFKSIRQKHVWIKHNPNIERSREE